MDVEFKPQVLHFKNDRSWESWRNFTLPCRISFSKGIVSSSCLSIELDIVRRIASSGGRNTHQIVLLLPVLQWPYNCNLWHLTTGFNAFLTWLAWNQNHHWFLCPLNLLSYTLQEMRFPNLYTPTDNDIENSTHDNFFGDILFCGCGLGKNGNLPLQYPNKGYKITYQSRLIPHLQNTFVVVVICFCCRHFFCLLLLDLCTDLINSISSNCLYSSTGGSVIMTTPVE